ncbi:MAG: phage tail sheath C-terminal domain-containing protein [Cyanobacteria bacterium J06598_3]
MAEMILPGTYIEVRDEGLISAGQVSTGNIGIVGTAVKGRTDRAVLISSLTEAREIFGPPTADTNLLRALELIYKNGGRTVYAVRTGKGSRYDLKYKGEDEKEASELVLTLVAKTPGLAKPPGVDKSSGVDKTPGVDNSSGKDGIKVSITITSITDDSAPPDDGAESAEPKKEETAKPKKKKKKKVTIEQASGGDNGPESYTVVSLEDLAEQINRKSKLVMASDLNESLKTKLPEDVTATDGKFTGGEDANYGAGLVQLEQDIVNIVVLAGQDASNTEMLTALEGHLKTTADIKRERIGIIGTGFDEETGADESPKDVPDNGRLILTTPGVLMTEGQNSMRLSGGYMAAAIAGVISSLPVKTSLTNKTLALEGLTTVFNSGKLEKLVQDRVLAVEKRNGFRIVKGITTSKGAWQQITTRRIVDYAIYGVRSACDPYIGKLNNVRVRGAMKATLDGFLTRMVDDESLVSYKLEVSATREQEINGKAVVNMTLMPTFSIDFIQVTMSLS